jgi:putative Mn2+ efflux pump MntP
MIQLICAGLLLSIDSFVVSFALGTCRVTRRQENRLAVAFGVCDGVAWLIGCWLQGILASKIGSVLEWGGPAFVLMYSIVVLLMARMGRSLSNLGSRRGQLMLFALPLVMSLDNLVAPISSAATGSPVAGAAVVGLVSGLASLCGFRAGALASTAIRRAREASGLRWNDLYFGGIIMFSAAILLAVI